MRKIVMTLLAFSYATAFALDNSGFQEFDNQYNVGYSFGQMMLANGANNQTSLHNQTMDLEVEHLFDNGVWFDVTGSLLMSTYAVGNSGATGAGQGGDGVGTTQNPMFAGVNGKVGYAFPLLSNNLQLISYGLIGYNTNLAASTMLANNLASINNDFFRTLGAGARLEYRINRTFDLYADQNLVYNWDISNPQSGIAPQNNMVFTTTIGAKFNIYRALQLGVNTFYNNYQYVNASPNTTSINGGCPTGCSVYQPQNQFGGMITIGLTY